MSRVRSENQTSRKPESTEGPGAPVAGLEACRGSGSLRSPRGESSVSFTSRGFYPPGEARLADVFSLDITMLYPCDHRDQVASTSSRKLLASLSVPPGMEHFCFVLHTH